MKIALAGNPNSGKTTLFNDLVGSNQFVGNWPGVTVEKKEGSLLADPSITIIDLPGIYSLSPYTMEEVVSKDYLFSERPDGIINIVDGSNLQRNLFLTSQLLDLGIPMVLAVNMADVMRKEGYELDTQALSNELGIPVVEISAAKGEGIDEMMEKLVDVAEAQKKPKKTSFSKEFEGYIKEINKEMDEGLSRFEIIKLFEADREYIDKLEPEEKEKLDQIVDRAEKSFDDDRESILTDERYAFIDKVTRENYRKKDENKNSLSQKLDKIFLNKYLGLPIFVLVIFLVYYLSISTVGSKATDFVNDGIFGEGWFFLSMGRDSYEEELESYKVSQDILEKYDPEGAESQEVSHYNEEEGKEERLVVSREEFTKAKTAKEPDPENFKFYVPSLPSLISDLLNKLNVGDFLQALILDGIVAGVGAVLGFLPQMFVLFICLSILEASGYMSRIAFLLDRIFKSFGLSGKSFIPMLVGTGCSVPGIMASRTIQSEKDRRMTILTTSFVPCSAKLPVIALIGGAVFKGAWWIAPSAYFLGIASVFISALILKKTRFFAGDREPFVMELPDYRLPGVSDVLRTSFDRTKDFVKKAGTIVLLSTMLIWFTSNYGFADGAFGKVPMEMSLLAYLGKSLAWIFKPLGWGTWENAVASISGLVAKENIVSSFAIFYSAGDVAENGYQIWNQVASNFTNLSAYSFLAFNLLAAPCFAAIGAMRTELGSRKLTIFAVAYLSLYAYSISLMIYQFGNLIKGGGFGLGSLFAVLVLAGFIYLLVRPDKNKAKAN